MLPDGSRFISTPLLFVLSNWNEFEAKNCHAVATALLRSLKMTAPLPFVSESSVRSAPVPLGFATVRPWPLVAASLDVTCSASLGLAVPTPTLPLALMSIELVGAPGRMRNGRREPPVTSRTKKFASLPAISHVCAVKPPELFCSRRSAGVLLVATCRSRTGVEVRKPTRPVLSTKIEFVEAPAVTVNGTFDPVMSSIENLLEPPLAESFAVSCQSFAGTPAPVDVSSNLMRVLFSLRRIVSKPNDSLFTQSRPTQALPWTIRSSGMTWSFTTGVPGRGAAEADDGSLPMPGSRAALETTPPVRLVSSRSGETIAPFATAKPPGWTVGPEACFFDETTRARFVAGVARRGKLLSQAGRNALHHRQLIRVFTVDQRGKILRAELDRRARGELFRVDLAVRRGNRQDDVIVTADRQLPLNR